MIDSRVLAAAMVLVGGLALVAQQQQPAAQQPSAPATAAAPTVPGVVNCPVPAPPATLPARSFSGAAGAILHQVPTAKVADFEMFLTSLREVLAKSTDAAVRAQWKGFRVYRDTTPGPNGDAVYVFLFEPAVPCVDYGLGPVISAAFTDPAERSRVWKLYEQSVKTMSLMNFVPAGAGADAAGPAAGTTAKPVPGSPAAKPAPGTPLDASPNRLPQN